LELTGLANVQGMRKTIITTRTALDHYLDIATEGPEILYGAPAHWTQGCTEAPVFVELNTLDDLVSAVAIARHCTPVSKKLDVVKMVWKGQPALQQLENGLTAHEKLELLQEVASQLSEMPLESDDG
jgi:hypothetical protein